MTLPHDPLTNALCQRLGIRWRKACNTRHTYATVALMAGVPPA